MPLLPGLSGAGGSRSGGSRGDVYWADPQFPAGRSNTSHRCVLLRSPRATEPNVPILTLHRLEKKPDAVSDCCMVLDAKSYRGISKPTVIDARMTMFVPVLMLREFCFSLAESHVEELENCLMEALEIT